MQGEPEHDEILRTERFSGYSDLQSLIDSCFYEGGGDHQQAP